MEVEKVGQLCRLNCSKTKENSEQTSLNKLIAA